MTDLQLDDARVERLLEALDAHLHGMETLGTLLDGHRRRRLLEAFGEVLRRLRHAGALEEAARRLARCHFDARLPFSLLMGSFNHLKARTLEESLPGAGDPAARFLELDQAFEAARRETARHYLLLEAATGPEMAGPLIGEKILVRLCTQWLDRIRHAIRNDLEGFPLEPAADTPFARALRYPDSLLICLDLKLCDQLYRQYRLMVQQAGLLYAMLAARRHEQACIAYQEVVRKSAELLNLLGVLYFEGETNRIHRFFRFLQAALYLPGRKYFCVLNLRALEHLNDLHGREAGDRALAAVETALGAEFRDNPSWFCYTRGIAGDFYLLGLDTTAETLERLCRRVEERVAAESRSLPAEVRLDHHGIELTHLNALTPRNAHLLVTYLRRHARDPGPAIETGAGCAARLQEWLKAQYRRTLDLRESLTEKATDIFVQPLVTLDDRQEIHAFEVLGRFRRGEEHIGAGLFIDDIVRMGLATDFDRLVLAAVVRQAPALKEITRRLFINVSATSLERTSYIEALTRALAGPLEGLEVVLELTEQVLLEQRNRIHELHRRHGLVFAIDDFGTGYSNLQTVIELALEGSIRYLKLDGSLTRSLDTHPASARILRITRRMARELGLATVAEFVETRSQAHRLAALRMDFGQGFLFGIPDPVEVWKGKMNYLRSRRETEEARFSL